MCCIIKKKFQCWFKTFLLCMYLFFSNPYLYFHLLYLCELRFFSSCLLYVPSIECQGLWASRFLFLHSMTWSRNWNEPVRLSIIEIINATELCIIASINVAKDLRGDRTRKEMKREKTWVTMRDQGILQKTLPCRRQISLVCLLPDNSDHFCVLNYLKEQRDFGKEQEK